MIIRSKFRKDNKDYGFKCKKNQCVITVINNYVKLESLVLVHRVIFPQLSDLQIVELDPKIFRLNVDGERVELKAEELQEQRLFSKSMYESNT